MRRLFPLLLVCFFPYSSICQPPSPSDHNPLAITNVTVIDMTGAPARPGMTVVVEGGRIGSLGTKPRIPRNANVIDGTGKFLIPGFWDMHVHVLNADRMLPLFVANGVLGVRDMGAQDLDAILKWREQAGSGQITSPRIVLAGKIVDGVPQADPETSLPAATPDEGRRLVRQLKQKGVDFIKVYDRLSRETYFAVADESKKLGLPFAGHVPMAITSIEASDARQKSIEHLGKILEDSSGAPEKIASVRAETIKENDYFAFTSRIGRTYDAVINSLDPKREAEIMAHFKRNGTWQVPTMSVKFVRTFIDDLYAQGDVREKYVERSQVDYWKPKNGFFSRYRTPDYIEAQKRYFARERQLLGEMQRAGLKIMAGTDVPAPYCVAGFCLHDELLRMVEAGMTPMQALMSATRNPAEYLGELDRRGTIEKGKVADLLLLDKNPLVDIQNTTRINGVIQNGRFIPRQKLDAILAKVEQAAMENK